MEEERLLEELESKLGIEFQNINLLVTALTHSSYANENKNAEYNERLEFLGDAVLQLSISEYFFKKYPTISEGELTKKRALVVCGISLHSIGERWQLGKYIRMSHGEELTGGRTRVSIIADCVEAVIAAIYLDKGFDTAKNFILREFEGTIQNAVENKIILDYKTRLQEILQSKGKTDIKYTLVRHEGPPHRRKFFVNLNFDNDVKSTGEGYTKKDAEQDAACKALKGLDN
ncbi:ribonuclease-3 [Clostridium acetobutylicum]|uniref:ribonuclease III n=1 Tax=Clostridium TaxID=1485 RepID=UPI000200A759|nr:MULTISPECIES: ribonuclease III [Clostridium]ADZ20798.1 ribonuclease III [Clostridium acetobutylicum EA 2018]AEI33311.1 ribonuclease III [Clostridium acetobutylicum DSM 1731]AWV79851.1 ribonuclease 3 [Clostridium acetobutylicum]MBC2394165.1 ribonuclease III [Clostridium acetobutylicum]MBC2584779.1 ribonuclease III [Clostridium acetobutylicum]